MAHHKGKDGRCNGQHHRFGKTAQHIENAAVPRLRGGTDIRSDFAHLGVHVVEQAGEVARDAIDQNAFYPFFDDLTNQRYLLSRALPVRWESAVGFKYYYSKNAGSTGSDAGLSPAARTAAGQGSRRSGQRRRPRPAASRPDSCCRDYPVRSPPKG